MKKISFLISFLLFILLFSCQQDESLTVNSSGDEIAILKGVLASSGIDTSEVVSIDDGFVFEGDIVFPYSVLEDMKNQVILKSYKYANSNWYVSRSSVQNIAVYIDPDVTDSGWIYGIDNAMDDWNSIPNCDVYFYEVSSSSTADIEISMFTDESESASIAFAEIGHYGDVGSFVRLNTKYNIHSGSTKHNTVAHELGHTIGFCHNQTYDGTHYGAVIPGTSSTTDTDAVMYMHGHYWNEFSSDEVSAAQKMWRDLDVFGPTDLSGIMPKKSYTWAAIAPEYRETVNFEWSISYATTYTTLSEGTQELKLYAKYESFRYDGNDEEYLLMVEQESTGENTYITLNVPDGYCLYESLDDPLP